MPSRERRLKAEEKRKQQAAPEDDAKAGEQEPLTNFRKGDAEQDVDDVLTNEDEVGKGQAQLRLAGQERKTNKRLEKAALKLNDIQTERLALQKKEKTAREELAKVMIELKVDQYDLPGDLEAVLDKTEKAKVHARRDDDE